jgi:hypothetical protein
MNFPQFSPKYKNTRSKHISSFRYTDSIIYLKPIVDKTVCMPKVVVEWVTLLLEHYGSSGFKCRPRDRFSWLRFFVDFFSHPKQMMVWYLKNCAKTASFHPLSNLSFIYFPLIRRYIPVFIKLWFAGHRCSSGGCRMKALQKLYQTLNK